MKKSLLITVAVILFFSFNIANANSGIPGPILLAGGSKTANFWQWVSVMMFMCIGIEGAIYKYANIFEHPIVCSLISNVVSLIVGFPLVLLGAIDPTFVILPTAVSIITETITIKFLPASIGIKSKDIKQRWKAFRWIIGANILTNLTMAGYLFWIYKYYNNDIPAFQ